MKDYRVNAGRDSKEFEKLADARKYKKQIKARLPDDAVVVIEQRELAVSVSTHPEYMWVPFE